MKDTDCNKPTAINVVLTI